jgi:hypothetical protein
MGKVLRKKRKKKVSPSPAFLNVDWHRVYAAGARDQLEKDNRILARLLENLEQDRWDRRKDSLEDTKNVFGYIW